MTEGRAIYAGVTVDMAEDALARAAKLLAGIPGGAKKAVGSALSRAAATGKTYAKTPVSEEYAISSGQFLRYTKTINHYRESGGTLSVELGFRGNVIPLMQFNTRVSRDGRVTTEVKRGRSSTLTSAFYARMGSHAGIYERLASSRFPVQELYGPATPQMMYSNEAVLDRMEEHMAETFDKRIDHEMLRVMNGWGR